MTDISSTLGSFELVDIDDANANTKANYQTGKGGNGRDESTRTTSKKNDAYDWKPAHWLSFPVKEDYDIVTPPWIRPEQVSMSFVGVNVVDVEKSTIKQSMTVKIKSGKIESISKSTLYDMQESGWLSIDAEGLYICPGLIDVHTHITAFPGGTPGAFAAVSEAEVALKTTYVLKGMLFRGFTTVRDVGGANRHYADATRDWLVPGPRIFQGGPVLSQTGGHGDVSTVRDGPISCCGITPGSQQHSGLTVDGVDACLKATRKLMMAGADHIKICSSGGVASLTDKLESEQFTVPEIKAICDTVRMMKGTLVTAHCFTSAGARAAIEGGIGGIEHGHLLDDDVLKLMAAKGVHLTPTLIVQELLDRPPYSAILAPASREKLKQVIDGGYKVIKRAHELGVNVAFGTDCFSAQQPVQLSEFDLRKRVLPSHVILKQATVNGAKVLGMQGKLGVIAPGAFADLLLLSSNPLEDVTILNKPLEFVQAIVKDGRVVRSNVCGLRVEVPLV